MHETVAAPAHPPADAESPFPPSGGSDDDAAQRPWWRRKAGLITQWALVLAALAAVPLYRDELPDLGAVWTAASHADPGWLTMVVLAVAGSMGAFARLQRRLLRVGGLRMTLRRAFAITYAGNALSTTLPAGPAVSVVYTFRQFRRGGASARLATAVILAGGVITTTAYSLVGLLALLADPHARGPALIALSVPLVLAVPLVPALRRPRLRARLTAPLRRAHGFALAHPRIAPYAERLAGVRDVLRPTARDWAALVSLALLNWVFDILALLSAAHAVGIDVAPNGVAIAYFAAQAAGSMLPLLPGGLGAIEGSMAASLVAFGATLSPAAAAVGVYRLVSYWAVVAVGWLAWATLHEPARIRSRLTAVGNFLMDGLTAFAFVTPYTTVPLQAPEARRP
ncbi:lysylphosphatidylglycerol synthase transmembrane domain-containing protein [Actinomadura sp. BRA 177]|uniref:lysylphosphatidylglycerol synthase transmembrane domain-containing protein n=1 Tax=Actinomadura sp. BRA 177 TaxID=2745202 RepID=UPI001595CADF|nr:lysylphosphatidylglycerol synthase transmembrane domain-containing protein [Actinomadura sp. BRA 177]NVI92325.1 flippase-like domain-containing protein [Actinomadura sp. BRA 177]